ncbi:MAG: 1-aminocyclopropane-1-carboxylate deaminase/D-cysteine desulfhydrase, partial [Bacteroidota bacterium]
FGGFAKRPKELLEFIESFEKDFNIKLDPIYTAKMLYGIFDLIDKERFPRGSKILAIHTGGLPALF